MNISTLLSSNNPMYLAFVGFVGTVLLLIMYNINPILVPALIVAFYIFYVISIINPNKHQFVDHRTTIKILVKFYLPQAAQVTILR